MFNPLNDLESQTVANFQALFGFLERACSENQGEESLERLHSKVRDAWKEYKDDLVRCVDIRLTYFE